MLCEVLLNVAVMWPYLPTCAVALMGSDEGANGGDACHARHAA